MPFVPPFRSGSPSRPPAALGPGSVSDLGTSSDFHPQQVSSVRHGQQCLNGNQPPAGKGHRAGLCHSKSPRDSPHTAPFFLPVLPTPALGASFLPHHTSASAPLPPAPGFVQMNRIWKQPVWLGGGPFRLLIWEVLHSRTAKTDGKGWLPPQISCSHQGAERDRVVGHKSGRSLPPPVSLGQQLALPCSSC